MRFRVEDASGRILNLEAVDWMIAMVRATEAFGATPSGLDCEHRGNGVVHVSDPSTGDWWKIIALPGSQVTPDPVSRVPTPMMAPRREDAMVPPRARRYRTPVRKPLWSPDSEPRLAQQPEPPKAEAPPPNLAERLFELASDIRAQPDARAAAREALRIAMVLVPCEAGSVLRGGRDDDAFEFFVISGGAGEALVGRRLPFGAGIAGAAYDAGVTILVDDVSTDPRHMAEIDLETGFQTRSLLCVPIRSDAGFHGVLELLNPTRGLSFAPWHVDVAESVAAALAETVA